MNEGQRKEVTEAVFRGGSQAVIAVREVFSVLAAAEQRAEELEQDLRLNASTLARQTDMAREAELQSMQTEAALGKTMTALGLAVVPLEALHASMGDSEMLMPEVRAAIAEAVVALRAIVQSALQGRKEESKP